MVYYTLPYTYSSYIFGLYVSTCMLEVKMISFKKKFANNFGMINSITIIETFGSFEHIIFPTIVSFVSRIDPDLGAQLFLRSRLCSTPRILVSNLNEISYGFINNKSALYVAYIVSRCRSLQEYFLGIIIDVIFMLWY